MAKHPRGVMVVCQSDNTLGALAAILHQNNEAALTATATQDAWDCIKAGAVGCVVQDLTQQGVDPLTLFRAARSCQATSWIPFLFLVKKDFHIPNLDLAGPELARDSWLVLPCSAQLFLTSVRALLDQRLSGDMQNLAPLPGLTLADLEADPAGEDEDHVGTDGLDSKTVFAGQIGQLDVTKILSMVEPLRLTGTLKVGDSKRVGNVYFVDGAVRHAQLNEIEGPDALFLLFHLKAGAFRFELSEPCGKRSIEGNTMALLLEGLRQMDEAKQLVKALQERRNQQQTGAPTPG
jgi:hypothetical protein